MQTTEEQWELLDFQSESELLAVKTVESEHPVAWEWFRRQLKRCHQVEVSKALHSDGDMSTRARGAACAFELLMREVSEIGAALREVSDE